MECLNWLEDEQLGLKTSQTQREPLIEIDLSLVGESIHSEPKMTTIRDNFEMVVEKTIICLKCNRTAKHLETFQSLSLDFHGKRYT